MPLLSGKHTEQNKIIVLHKTKQPTSKVWNQFDCTYVCARHNEYADLINFTRNSAGVCAALCLSFWHSLHTMDAPLVLEQLIWKAIGIVAPLVTGDSRAGFFESKWLCRYNF